MPLLFPISALLATTVLLWFGKQLALRVGFFDHPGGRKQHDAPVPPIGGLVILPVFVAVCWLAGLQTVIPWPLVAGLGTLLVMGAVDDVRPVKPGIKFAIMVWTAAFVVIFGNAQIGNLGDLFGFGTVELGFLSKGFTILCLVLLMNAVNMMDGVDGLSGGFIALVAFWFMIVCIGTGQSAYALTLAILLCCMIGFLVYNLRNPLRKRASIFMGDAGALCLGLLLGWFSIKLTQGVGAPMKPVTVIWIIAVPVMDAFALFLSRSLKGLHPFYPDRHHLHHRFLDAGFSGGQTTAIILSLIAFFALIGFVAQANGVPAFYLFYGWMGLFVFHTFRIMHPNGYSLLHKIADRTSKR